MLTPERWQKVRDVLEQAMELAPEKWAGSRSPWPAQPLFQIAAERSGHSAASFVNPWEAVNGCAPAPML